MGGETVSLKNGYPDATANGIRNAIFDSDGFTATEGAGSVTFIRADAPAGKQCSVTYRAAPKPVAPRALPIRISAVAKLRDSRIFILRVYAHIGSAYKVVRADILRLPGVPKDGDVSGFPAPCC